MAPARNFGLVAVVIALALATSAPAAVAPGATPAVDGLTVDDVREKWRKASGADKSVRSEIEVWATRAHGVDGTLRRVRFGDDWIETVERGTAVRSNGLYHGKRWRENLNGLVLIAASEAAGDLAPVAETLAHVRSPVDAYVIETEASNGSRSRSYFDAQTFLVVRRERLTRGAHSYTVYADFQTDAAGRTLPRHVYGGDDRPNDDFDERLVSDDLSARVAESDVAIPSNRRTLVEFPEGRSTVRLPARIIAGAIVVRVQIGERGIDFILDSGCSSIVLDSKVAGQLGLARQAEGSISVPGNVSMTSARIPKLTIGELTLNDVVVQTLPFSHELDAETRVAGLLGFDFFAGAAITVDYRNATVDATAPGAFAPAAADIPVEVALPDGVPLATLQMGSVRGDRFIIDTGAFGATVVLFQHFVRGNESTAGLDAQVTQGEQLTTMVGGQVGNTPVVIRQMTFGPLEVRAVPALLTRSPAAFDAEDGLIGSPFLSNFVRVTFDEGASKVYVQSDPGWHPPAARQEAGQPLDWGLPPASLRPASLPVRPVPLGK